MILPILKCRCQEESEAEILSLTWLRNIRKKYKSTDNNASERAINNIKIKQKVSTQFSSVTNELKFIVEQGTD